MSAFTDALASGSTAFAKCFRLARRDGVVLGFTDHDDDISFDGVTYAAGSALSATEASASLGMAPDELDAGGALSAEAITEADIHAGRYDGAAVVVFDVQWRDPEIRRIAGRYTIGQIERGGLGFRAELRSLAAGLDRKAGRVHATLCDARLGDNRCRVDLSAPGRSGALTVVSVDGLDLTVSGLEAFGPGAFDRGAVTFTSGANTGGTGGVRISRAAGSRMRLSLWRPLAAPVSPGDTASIVVGCDKTAETCRGAFGNLVNFQGFPHMPGETFVSEYATTGDPSNSGGSRFE